MPSPTVVVVMGVAGVGKTRVGRAVAARLGWDFFDADEYHPAENVAKMGRGEGLTDADRAPWLDALRALIVQRLEHERPAVLACSALRAAYRERLRVDARVVVVWLDAAPSVIATRLAARRGHFAGPDLLASQLATLEPPSSDAAVRVLAEGTVAEVARRAIEAVGAREAE